MEGECLACIWWRDQYMLQYAEKDMWLQMQKYDDELSV